MILAVSKVHGFFERQTYFSGPNVILSNIGDLCQDRLFPAVADEVLCQSSFATIKSMYPNATNKVQSDLPPWPTRPKGCFFYVPDMQLLWNTHKNGSRSEHDRQVCDLSGRRIS